VIVNVDIDIAVIGTNIKFYVRIRLGIHYTNKCRLIFIYVISSNSLCNADMVNIEV
jgi:hypothetical protein